MCSPSNFNLVFVYVTIILIKRERRKLYHFTSSSGVTDINALHDAYGAYVQFSAFRSLFVINPSIFLFFMSTFWAENERAQLPFRSFLFFCERRMKNHHKKSNRNLVKAHTHHTMLRKIAQTSVSRHAQMRNALANGSMVRVSRSHASLYFYNRRFFFLALKRQREFESITQKWMENWPEILFIFAEKLCRRVDRGWC